MSEPVILDLSSRNGKNVSYNYLLSIIDDYRDDPTVLNFIYDSIVVIDRFRVILRDNINSVFNSLKESEKTL